PAHPRPSKWSVRLRLPRRRHGRRIATCAPGPRKKSARQVYRSSRSPSPKPDSSGRYAARRRVCCRGGANLAVSRTGLRAPEARGLTGRRLPLADLDLALDLDRNAEGQFSHADGAARMGAPLLAKDLDDQVAESVDDCGLPVEARRRIDHAEHSGPGDDAIQAAEFTLQAAPDGKTGQPCRRLGQ